MGIVVMDERGVQVLGGGRFEVVRQIGEGGQGRTFLARDLGARDVVVKELLLGRVGEWKSVELFEREGRALRNVRHAQVPAYVDAFVGELDGRFYLVQEYVEGEDLQARIDAGDLMDEGAALDFLEQMLGVLVYLHGLSPPVIHRDLKPSNVMRRVDGTYMLIDFGAVQSMMSDRVGGSTVVGTSGYMAPEQLMGRAVASSDLYSLAATVVHAVVGIQPLDMPVVRLRLDFRELAGLSDGLSDVLEKMLAPEIGARFESAADVLVALSGVRSLGEGRLVRRARSGVARGYRPSEKMQKLLLARPADEVLLTAQVVEGKLRVEGSSEVGVRAMIRLWKRAAGVVFFVLVGILYLMPWVFSLMAVVVAAVLLWSAWRRIGLIAVHDVLIMSGDGVQITKYGLDSSVVWEKSLPYEDIERVYIDLAGKDELEGRYGGVLKTGTGHCSSGVVYLMHDQRRYLFGKDVLFFGYRTVPEGGDYAAFDWIEGLIKTYWSEISGEVNQGAVGLVESEVAVVVEEKA